MRVAIIGAGICGLYLAWKLSEKGFEVTVFEKKEKIGKEVCSGLFSERILEFIPESEKLIQNQIESVLIHLPSDNETREGVKLLRTPKRTLKVKFSKKFFVINHFELDRLVASLAEKSGAKIVLKYNVKTKDFVTFQGEFDRIIGCDGANSFTRKNLGLNDPKFYLGIRGFVPLTPDFSNFVETWQTENGFLWKIPRGKEGIEYGIIEKPGQAKKLLDKFLEGRNIHLEGLNSALIPQGLVIPDNSKITLCGDSVGLTKPWSGGGVIWSLIAADILLKNFPNFLKYQKEIKKFFFSKIIFSKMAKILVYFFGFHFPWIFPKEIKIEGDFLISKLNI
jgi:flavin-dependent dehydrogenase